MPGLGINAQWNVSIVIALGVPNYLANLINNESLMNNEKETNKSNVKDNDDIICSFVDIGRIKLNRKKQRSGMQGLRELLAEYSNNKGSQVCAISNNSNGTIGNKNKKKLNPIGAGTAVSGLFVIFYDGVDCFRIKNIPDTHESWKILEEVGINNICGSVDCTKAEASSNSLLQSDKRSSVV
jgi:hypothetical protein